MEAYFPEPAAANNLAGAVAYLHGPNSYAVPNRFEVIITAPMPNYAEQREVSLRCETVSIPGRNLNTLTDSNIYGPTREVVDCVMYAEDITMTFTASSGLKERVFFEKWQEMAFDLTTWNLKYYNDYVSSVNIYLLDRQDKRQYGIKLVEAFPKTISGTDLSQATGNEIIKISVSFSFRYWETLDVNRQEKISTNNDTRINAVERMLSVNQPAAIKRLNSGIFPSSSMGSFRGFYGLTMKYYNIKDE